MPGGDLVRDNLRELAATYAWALLTTPYRWGGDDPSGFDCSGLCVEILQAVGLLPRHGDWNAQALYNRFEKVGLPRRGCLALWGEDAQHVTHVEFVYQVIDVQAFTVGASGGGSKTKTTADAWTQNAFVKLRPVAGPGARDDFVGYVDPFRVAA